MTKGCGRFRGRLGTLFFCLGIILVLTFSGPGAWAEDRGRVQDLYLQAQSQKKAGHYGPAILDYKAVLSLDPGYFWAYKGLGDAYFYLGKKTWALQSYDRYLKAHPHDRATRAFAASLYASLEARAAAREPVVQNAPSVPVPAATPTVTVEPHMAFGLQGFYGTYALSQWNAALNQTVDNSSGSYKYIGSSDYGGPGLGVDFRYFFEPRWSAGAFLEYMSSGGSFTNWWTYSSGTEDATGAYSLPLIFVGPQGSYTFYRSPRWSADVALGLGYAALLGAYLNYTTYTVDTAGTSEEPVQASLSDGGFGAKLALGVDFKLTQGYSLSGALGYRSLAMGKPVANVGGNFQTLESGSDLDFSGFFLDIGIANWR
jgi:hypothetical protein